MKATKRRNQRVSFLGRFFEAVQKAYDTETSNSDASLSAMFERINEVRGGGGVDTPSMKRYIGVFIEHNARFDNKTARFYIESEHGIVVITPCKYGEEISMFCILNFSLENNKIKVDVYDIGDYDGYNCDDHYCIEKVDINSRDADALCKFYKIELDDNKTRFLFKRS